MPNGHQGQRRYGGGAPRRQGGGGGGQQTIRFEIPRRAAPGYISTIVGDQHTRQSCEKWRDMPPGHRFQIYFHGMADKGEVDRPEDKNQRKTLQDAAENGKWDILERNAPRITECWVPLKNQKRVALEAAAGMGKTATDLLGGLRARSLKMYVSADWQREVVLIAPLATGLGNPHPVENGFAFLSPYGVPYLAGSGVKGVLRRAAEELALFDDESPWQMSHVWTLFGFDESSAYLGDGTDETGWSNAYRQWIEQVEAEGDPVLTAWKRAINAQLPKKPCNWQEATETEFLHGLIGEAGKPLRRAIHWRGLLAFFDAFPDEQAKLAVDILNPHHKTYYEGNGTPHDAENPVPVFFLTVAPGARFTFSAKPIAGREPLWQAIRDWKALLDAAFDHACDWLGFGAKTAVGYGAMRPEPAASPTTAGNPPAPVNAPAPGVVTQAAPSSVARGTSTPPPRPAPSQETWPRATCVVEKNPTRLRVTPEPPGPSPKRAESDPALDVATLLQPLGEEAQRKVLKKGQAVMIRATVEPLGGTRYRLIRVEPGS